MKYIVMQTSHPMGDGDPMIREFPIIFPEALTHSIVAAALERYCPELRHSTPVSAGFISSMNSGRIKACHGKSETLRLKSRGEIDDQLMIMWDYQHGVQN